MERLKGKKRKRSRRKIHIRKRISGTAQKPRLTVYNSNRYLYVQAIDDLQGATLACASNREKELSSVKRNVSDAARLGEAMGARLKAKKITSAVFDRNGYSYHGIVKAIADGIRKAGIQF